MFTEITTQLVEINRQLAATYDLLFRMVILLTVTCLFSVVAVFKDRGE